MSDTDGHEPDMNSSEAGHELIQWVSIQAAAVHLGISERAVYKRCRSGTLKRRSLSNGRVEVALPLSKQSPEPGHEPEGEVQEPTARTSGTGHEPGHEPSSDALVEQLQSENRFLRLQLQQRDVAESEFRRLLLADRQELARLMEENRRLLAAPIPYEVSVQETVEEPVQDAQEGTQTPVSAQETANTDNLPLGTETGSTEVQETAKPRRWWEVWKR